MKKTLFSKKFTKRQQKSLRSMGFEPYYNEDGACGKHTKLPDFYIWNNESYYDVVDYYIQRYKTSTMQSISKAISHIDKIFS